MLSKRNFAMMMIMNLVVLVLFLFSAVSKEYFNDYDVNHAAETEWIDKTDQKMEPENGSVHFHREKRYLHYRSAEDRKEAGGGLLLRS